MEEEAYEYPLMSGDVAWIQGETDGFL